MALAEELREYRRQGKISSEVNVGYHPPEVEGGRKELYINCDPGRVRRPLIAADAGTPKLTEEHLASVDAGRLNWQDVVRSGVVELLNADVKENAQAAMYEQQIRKKRS